MGTSVPYIWTLQDEARGLSTSTAGDMDDVALIRRTLPQAEITSCAAPKSKPAEIDFDEMLSERPSLFTRVAITTKTRPRESLAPESAPASIPTILIPSMLKRMATEIPSSTSRPSKRTKTSSLKKKVTQVLARDSKEEETHSVGVESQVGPVAPHTTTQRAPVVDLESSATVSDQGAAYPDEGGGSLREDLETSFPPPPLARKNRPMSLKSK
ncbi:hypothetical protein LIER_33501 [Lithospermum erythrorhizon]|uniref:Uncharacterized protein n=1 Tax=Lithospermum erythrorhizon TaxID=34254 RepID=A0AAV3RX13_LITER